MPTVETARMGRPGVGGGGVKSRRVRELEDREERRNRHPRSINTCFQAVGYYICTHVYFSHAQSTHNLRARCKILYRCVKCKFTYIQIHVAHKPTPNIGRRVAIDRPAPPHSHVQGH